MPANTTAEPTAQERREAVCRAMRAAPGLIRYAARFTPSIEDAEDAYQRAMEIALTRAPMTDHTPFINWLHTVIRHEAARITSERQRETPVGETDLDRALIRDAEAAAATRDAVIEWRERYHLIHDALLGLPEAERVCLMLQSAGASRSEIQAATGYSERKVSRSITEGRARLQSWEVRLRSGSECARMSDLMDRSVDHTATGREQRSLSRHIRHCVSCRATYRHRREQSLVLGSFVPAGLIGAGAISAAPPDPGFALTWWDRVSGSAAVKVQHAMQVLGDAPAAIASTRAGAGAVAAVAAGAISAPLFVGGSPDHPPRAPAPRVTSVAAAASAPAPAQPVAPTIRNVQVVRTAPPARRPPPRVPEPPRPVTVRRPAAPFATGAAPGSAAAEFSP